MATAIDIRNYMSMVMMDYEAQKHIHQAYHPGDKKINYR